MYSAPFTNLVEPTTPPPSPPSSATLICTQLPTSSSPQTTTLTPTPPPSPPNEAAPSIIFSTTATLTNFPLSSHPLGSSSSNASISTRPSDPSLVRGHLLAQHLLGPQAHLRLEQDRMLGEVGREGRTERLRERVRRREEREKEREEERRAKSLSLSSTSTSALLPAITPINDVSTSPTTSPAIKKGVTKFLSSSLSLPSFNLQLFSRKPSFSLKRSSTRPDLSSLDEGEGKRVIRTVTVQSLARRTTELEELSGRGDALEVGGRAEVWFLG